MFDEGLLERKPVLEGFLYSSVPRKLKRKFYLCWLQLWAGRMKCLTIEGLLKRKPVRFGFDFQRFSLLKYWNRYKWLELDEGLKRKLERIRTSTIKNVMGKSGRHKNVTRSFYVCYRNVYKQQILNNFEFSNNKNSMLKP